MPGTRHPPRRSPRAGFPHWALVSGESVSPWPRQGGIEVGHRPPCAFQARTPWARHTALLPPPPKRLRPSPQAWRAARRQRLPVQRHPSVPLVAQEHRAPPSARWGHGSMPASPQCRVHGLPLGPQALLPRLPPPEPAVRRGLATDRRAAQDLAGGRVPRPLPAAVPDGTAPARQQASRVRVPRQGARRQSGAPCLRHRRRFGPRLEAQHAVLGGPPDAHLPVCVALPPSVPPAGQRRMARAGRTHGAAEPPRRHPCLTRRPPPLPAPPPSALAG